MYKEDRASELRNVRDCKIKINFSKSKLLDGIFWFRTEDTEISQK